MLIGPYMVMEFGAGVLRADCPPWSACPGERVHADGGQAGAAHTRGSVGWLIRQPRPIDSALPIVLPRSLWR